MLQVWFYDPDWDARAHRDYFCSDIPSHSLWRSGDAVLCNLEGSYAWHFEHNGLFSNPLLVWDDVYLIVLRVASVASGLYHTGNSTSSAIISWLCRWGVLLFGLLCIAANMHLCPASVILVTYGIHLDTIQHVRQSHAMLKPNLSRCWRQILLLAMLL